MEYTITLGTTSTAALSAMEQRLMERDPAALLDHDAPAGVLRCSTVALPDEPWHALHPLTLDTIKRQPSVCCGGCGG